MPESDIRKKFPGKKTYRGTQVIFGERQHLYEVLRSVRQARLPRARKQGEVRQLNALIRARSDELNRINPGWDRKYRRAQHPATASRELLRLAVSLPKEDFLLARVLTEHAQAPAELLERMASHPYSSVRENVARHPRTPTTVLQKMADDPSEPLWFLVACNPSTPGDLREKLRARMKPIP